MIEVPLALTDLALQLAGVALLWRFLDGLRRGGALRDPLAGPLPDREAPNLLDVLAVFAVYILAAQALQPAATPGDALPEPGSAAWHRAALGQSAAKSAGALASVLILWRRGLFRRVASRLTIGRLAALSLATTLIAMAVCYPQLLFARWAWSLFAELPPPHPTLEGLARNAWGFWGVAHLVVAAVIVAPLAEELLYRGVMLECVLGATRRPWLSVFVTSVVFAMVHSGPDQIPLFFLGLILGCARIRYRSLALVVLAHAMFNARTIAFSLLAPSA